MKSKTFGLVALAMVFLFVVSKRNASALVINLTYDTDAHLMAAGLTAQNIADMKAACQYTAAQYTSNYTDPIHVNIKVVAQANMDLGSSETTFDTVASYAALRTAVAGDATTADDTTTVGSGGSMRAGADPIAGSHMYNVTRVQAKALGLRADDAEIDGTFYFGGQTTWTYDPNNRMVPGAFDFIGTALHEYSEIMGRNLLMGDDLGTGIPQYCQYDLFHYTAAATRGLNTGPGRFFSFNNGTTLLAEFNDQTANMGDGQDWKDNGNDPYNAFGPPNEKDDLTTVDFQAMDVIGYDFTTGAGSTSLGNISTRGRVETGDSILIGGFIISGTQPKKVMLRAIGPSLSRINPPLPGVLADPTLELRSRTGAVLASNDNWMDAANKQEIINTRIAPTDPAESAILISLPANAAYTTILRGVNNTTGLALVEVYDLDNTVDSKLSNISTRGMVRPDPDALIGGFIVAGAGTQTIVVRALGPSLAAARVPNVLADPIVELRNSNGVLLAMNDNWKDNTAANQKVLTDNRLAPTNNFESAVVITLAGGGNATTAIVRGVNGTSGNGLVEVYRVTSP